MQTRKDKSFSRRRFLRLADDLSYHEASKDQESAQTPSGEAALPLKAVIGANCFLNQQIQCSSCLDGCEPRALKLDYKRGKTGFLSVMNVDEERCTGCGDCLSICPASAIQLQHSLHEKQALKIDGDIK